MASLCLIMQANSEVSTLLGRIPSAVRYQPTVATYPGGLQKRSISSTQAFNMPSIQQILANSRIKVLSFNLYNVHL